MPDLKLLLLLCLSAVSVTADVDTSGTEFLTIFPWNNNDVDAQPQISMSFVNFDSSVEARVFVEYSVFLIYGDDIVTQVKNTTLTVRGQSSTQFTFGSDSVYQYLSIGLNKNYPSTKIHILSTSPISVFAHNFIDKGIGDTFAVLPVRMASNKYAFSLPPNTNRKGIAMVYFLPTLATAKIDLVVSTGTTSRDYSITAGSNLLDPVVMFGGPPKDFSIYANSDNPFLVVAAVRMLPTSRNKYDFGCYMPTPVVNDDCSEGSVEDIHATDLAYDSYYTITAPNRYCSPFTVRILSPSKTGVININPRVVSEPYHFRRSVYGDNLVISSQDAMLEIVRCNGFLDNFPSLEQAVTGTTGYYVFDDEVKVTVYGDNETHNTARNDGGLFALWQEIHTGSGIIYHSSFNVSAGVHYVTAEGRYLVTVTALNDDRSYGYTPRFMWRGKEATTIAPPVTPSQQPQTPSQQPQTPSQQPQTPSQQPQTPSQQPPTPSQQPPTPSQQPPTPSQQPQTPSQQPQTPSTQVTSPRVPTTTTAAGVTALSTALLVISLVLSLMLF